MIGFVLALLLVAGSETAFPGGTVEVPVGCSGPALIPMGTDSFIGSIECPQERLTIFIEGDGVGPMSYGPAGREVAALALPGGHPVRAYAIEHEGLTAKRIRQKLVIDVGAAHIIADVRTSRDAFLLLQIASSFRLSSRVGDARSNEGLANKQLGTKRAQAMELRR